MTHEITLLLLAALALTNIALVYEVRRLKGAIMANIDEVIASVSLQSTKLDSVIALIDGLKQQLADVLSGVVLPPAVQEKVDALFDIAQTNAAKIADALDENVEPPPAASKKR